jgi:NADH-quinone oxidoreductase subunit L
MFMAFFGQPRDAHAAEHAHESPPVMTFPLGLLALGALVAGALAAPYFIGSDAAAFWRTSLATLPGLGESAAGAEAHHVPGWVAFLPTVMMAVGFVLAWFAYVAAPWVPAWTVRNFRFIHAFLYHKWYFDELYNLIFVRPVRWLSRVLWIYGDGAIIDGLGPDGVSARVIDITNRAVRLQTGYVYHYAFVMLLGVAILVSYFTYLFLQGTF